MSNPGTAPTKSDELSKKWAQLAALASTDAPLRQQLRDNPARVLKAHGIEIPAGFEVRVVEDTATGTYLTVTPQPGTNVAELTADQLSSVAGGRPAGGTTLEYLKIKMIDILISG